MSYYRFGQSYRNQKPAKKGRFSFSKNKTKRVKHYEDAALTLANPFRRAAKVKNRHFKLRNFIFPALLATWLGLMLYLPYFSVNKILPSGLKVISNTDLQLAIEQQFLTPRFGYPANNYFLVSENNIANFLQDKYALNGVTVKKVFPNTLQVAVQEKVTSAIYDNGHAYYMMGEDGTIIKFLRDVRPSEFAYPTSSPKTATTTTTSTPKVAGLKITAALNATSTTNTDPLLAATHIPAYGEMMLNYGTYPLLYDLRHERVVEKTAIIDPTTTKGFITFYNALERGKVVKVTYATISEADGGITLYTAEPWKILMQPGNDLPTQINNLKIILKNSHPTEYIDLRFGDRVYWK